MTDVPSAALVPGILLGLSAAFCQACSYVGSRHFFAHCRPSSRLLFGLSHLQMGLAAVIALPFLLHGPLPPPGRWLLFLAGNAGCYLAGQWMLFIALKTQDASAIVPLLGFKIPILAAISVLAAGRSPSLLGWLAILVCVGAGLLISPPTGRPAVRSLVFVFLACLGYCGSDICIPLLVRSLDGSSRLPVLLAVSLSYTLCGGVGLIVALRFRALRDRRVVLGAVPNATAWLLAMCFLFGTFAVIGVVPGNMLQSTRGIWSVALGAALTRIGWVHLDDVRGRGILGRRLAGAVLMSAAIVLYLHAEVR